jgi:glycosyltransferase involved in cell wall biosynthesis
VYNGEKDVKRMINSIEQNNNQNDWELIVIDDGSIDNTFLFIKESLKTAKFKYKIWRTKNRGLSAARNFGIQKSTGSYIWFVDHDDEIVKNSIDFLIEKITKYDFEVFAFSNDVRRLQNQVLECAKIKRYSGSENLKYLKSQNQVFDYFENVMKQGNFSSCCQYYICKRSFLEICEIQFKSILFEDQLFTSQVFLNAEKIILTNEILYIRIQTLGSIMQSPVSLEKILSEVKLSYYFSRLSKDKKYKAASPMLKSRAVRYLKRAINKKNKNGIKSYLLDFWIYMSKFTLKAIN